MTVTFFGHRDAPKEIEPTLRTTLIDLIENRNATDFYVGTQTDNYPLLSALVIIVVMC